MGRGENTIIQVKMSSKQIVNTIIKYYFLNLCVWESLSVDTAMFLVFFD